MVRAPEPRWLAGSPTAPGYDCSTNPSSSRRPADRHPPMTRPWVPGRVCVVTAFRSHRDPRSGRRPARMAPVVTRAFARPTTYWWMIVSGGSKACADEAPFQRARSRRAMTVHRPPPCQPEAVHLEGLLPDSMAPVKDAVFDLIAEKDGTREARDRPLDPRVPCHRSRSYQDGTYGPGPAWSQHVSHDATGPRSQCASAAHPRTVT